MIAKEGEHSLQAVRDYNRSEVKMFARWMDVDNARSKLSCESMNQTYLYIILKRTFDVLISLAVLIVTLPLWIVVAILIKTDSHGPVFFKHQRIGKNGKLFTLIKFRTMYYGVNVYEKSPKDDTDERVTKIGRRLRAVGLDEVPQLFNIIKGDMSLVGPRPEMPFIVEKYTPYVMIRLAVQPGLTGLWQILGPKDQAIHENIEYDLYYIKARSIKLDLWLIFLTGLSILRGKVIRRGKYLRSILKDMARIHLLPGYYCANQKT